MSCYSRSQGRSLRRSVLSLLCILSGVCAAQGTQFLNVPEVESTGSRVSSFQAGIFQRPQSLTDLLYIGAPTVSGTTSSVIVGDLLNQGGPGFNNFGENQIIFSGVTNLVAALGDFDGDQNTDFAFALTTSSGSPNLCIYYGTGANIASALAGNSSFSGGNAYPPTSNKSGCTTFAVLPGGIAPSFSYIATLGSRPGLPPQLAIEDSANNVLYVFANAGTPGIGGTLTTFTVIQQIPIPPGDGTGPISIGDFNGDGIPDFIVNGQKSFSASVYLGKADGTFQLPVRYTFDHNVHSLLLHDMDFDNHLDMIVEGDKGVIEIFKGNADGTFAKTSMGGTPAGLDGFSGNGGHLAAIQPTTLDILTTTPIGLSVLHNQGGLSYALKAVYNIGPGRTSFALADFFGTNTLDFAVDSPEGIAIVAGNGDGSFQTSRAFAALAPALGAVVGKFRNFANNPSGSLDVVVDTGATQAQLLEGNGDGTFTTFPGLTNTTGSGGFNIPPNLWSNILPGDFNGDGNLDFAYSVTGLPSPGPGTATLLVQYGIADGTFGSPSPVQGIGTLTSAAGDFNGDGRSDLAIVAAGFDGTLLGQAPTSFNAGFLQADPSNTSFNQVASGFFKTGRTSKQDLVFQEGANFIPYKNSGDGISFTKMPAVTGAPAPLYATTVLLTDLDGDGNADLVVIYYNTAYNPVGAGPVAANNLYIWYGNGDGTFSAVPQTWPLSRNFYLGAVADMNRDGLPDIILSDGSLVSIVYNQGGRSFGVGGIATEQHFLAGQGINSITVADVNGDGEPDLIVANGGVTISNAIALGGKTASSLSLTPNPDPNTGGITVLINTTTTSPVTGTLAATPEPSNYAATFTLTATLKPAAGVAVPTGTVQFLIDGIAVGTPVNLVPGATASAASYVVPAGNTYAGGPHTLTANYSGDAVNTPFTLLATHFVTAAVTTPPMIESLVATPEPSNFGARFILIAALTSSPGVAVPTGVVTFFIDGVQVGTGNLGPVPGSTTTSSANFPIPVGNVYPGGSHALSANYSGDAANSPITFAGTHLITGTTVTTLDLCVGPSLACPTNGFVNPPFASTLTMIYGQTYNGTASVTASDGGALPGSTLIYDAYNGAAPLLICTLATTIGGTCPPSVGIGAQVGIHILTAVYAPGIGDTHTGSTSLPVTITVTQDTTLATLVGTPNPSPAGQPVTFTATLTGSNATPAGSGPVGTYVPPTGPVVFTYGGSVLGTANLVAGAFGVNSTATLITSTLPVGSDLITATYAATPDFAAASATFTETITPSIGGSFTLQVTPTPVTVGVGNATRLTITVIAKNGFSQAVNLACGNLPNEAICQFDTPQIGVGGGPAHVIVFTTAPHSCGTTQPYFLGGNGAGPGIAPIALPALAGPMLAGLVLLFIPGKRRWLRALIALIVVAAATQITGCGNCSDLGTRPATYTFQITGTSATTSETESQAVTMTVAI